MVTHYFRHAMVVACTLSALAAQAAGAPADVRDAWVRATVPGQPVGAAYLTLQAHASATLVGVQSPQAGEVSLHEMVHEGNTMGMRPIGRLALKPGQTVRLTPNGMHLMLTGLKTPLKPGSSVALTLRWQVGGALVEQSVAAEVKPIGYQP